MKLNRTELAEVLTVGCCLAGGAEAIDTASDNCGPEDFANARAASAFKAMVQLVHRGDPVDVVTVATTMGGAAWNREAGGSALDADALQWLVDLETNAPSARDVAHHAKRVRTASRLRGIEEACRAGLAACQSAGDDTDAAAQVADGIVEGLLAVGDKASGATSIRVAGAVKLMLADFKARQSTPIERQYVRTGLRNLDGIIDGYRPGHMYLVGGASGHGKTGFLTFAAVQAAIGGAAALYATAEVPAEAIAQRIVCNVARVDGRKLEKLDLDRDETSQVVGSTHRIAEWPLSILDAPALTIGLLDREVRRHIKRNPERIGVLVVDYLQLLRANGRHGNREQEVAEVADGLLELTKRHRIVTIVGAQLNRAGAQRSDKRPISADLRESSRAEHNASVVLMLYRPAMNGDDAADPTHAEIICRKNRLGPLGTALCVFDAARNTWRDRDGY